MKKSYMQILKEYEEGRTTAAGFSLDLLTLLTQDELRDALELLPAEHVEVVRDFIETYRPQMRVFRGSLPASSMVKFAQEVLTKTVKSI